MKRIILLIFLIVVCTGFVSAVSNETIYASKPVFRSFSSTYVQVTSLKYEPYPANPGEYVTLWIKAENLGTKMTENLKFELVTEYPFSLDSNENPIREYGKLTSEEPVVMEFKIRVDKNAVEGSNEIGLYYNTDGGTSWFYKEFNVEIEGAQTDFDLVIQEMEGSTISIAIANTGVNDANSVIVRVPEQEYFETIGTNGQMVGNLEDGDYTLVSFDIIQKRIRTKERTLLLELKIDYTDAIGERRSLIKEVPYYLGSPGNFSSMTGINGETHNQIWQGRTILQRKSIYKQWWFWLILVALSYWVWKRYKLYRELKEESEIKELKSKKK